MSTLEYREAIRQALHSEMERDDDVVLWGEDVAAAGGVFKATPGLLDRFGAERVVDTPISELALAGGAFGAAVCGLRPVIEIMFGDFMALAMDSIVNQAAKTWYLSNERQPAPIVVRSAVGAGGRFGAIHSQNPAAWMWNVPGLKVVGPAFPHDARNLLVAAIRDDNPVVFLEHKRLYSIKQDAPAAAPLELGKASVVRPGRDLTLVTWLKGVHDALQAADRLADHGLDVEVVDLRGLRPLDADTIVASVERTNRLLLVEEGPALGGWARGVLGTISELALESLDDAWVLATDEHPIPYSPPLEDAFLPGVEAIVSSVLGRAGIRPAAATA
jgi:pyruvate/2-oxoglutarate/acetoin dehydrogenase E1 component